MNLEAMSGSCDSLRTNSLTSPTTSFFDTASISYNFWKYKAKEEDCAIHQKIVENTFIIRSKSFFKEWDSCILSISGSLLVYKKKKDEQKVKYIDFEDHMYRLEAITPSHKKYSAKYPYAFLIRANGNTMEFFCKEQDRYDNWIAHLKKFCILINFTENYKTKKILGTGGYGKVYALERLADNRMFAGKFIKFSPNVSKERQRAMIINEIKILRKFNHAQISELYEVYEMTGQVCLVMELIRGDKLFNLITEKRRFLKQLQHL